jgi:DNA-binding beta-propeller fold protein YncE
VLMTLLICRNGVLTTEAAESAPHVLISNFGDEFTSGIKRFDATTGAFVYDFALTNATIRGMALGPDGKLYAANIQANTVIRIDPETGQALGVFTSGGDLTFPKGVAFGPDGHLYVSDLNAVKRFNGSTGAYMNEVVALPAVSDLKFGPDGRLYLARVNSLLQYDAGSGKLLKQIWPGPFESLTFAPNGDLYASELSGDDVFRFEAGTFTYLGVFASGGGLNDPAGLAFGPDGNLYVVSNKTGSVKRYSGTTGAFMDDFIASPTGKLRLPWGILFRTAAPPASTKTTWDVDSGRPFYWETRGAFSCSSSNDVFTFRVEGLGQVEDVDIRLAIRQEFVGELAGQLTSPAGTRAVLFLYPNAGTDYTKSGAHFQDTYLDDEAADTLSNAAAPFAGPEYPGGKKYRLPQGTLSVFDGQDPNGIWKLEVFDDRCNIHSGPANAVLRAGDVTGVQGWSSVIGTRLIITASSAASKLRLTIQMSADRKSVLLAWPKTTTTVQLEEASEIAGPWSGSSYAPELSGSGFLVNVPIGVAKKFFRLSRP